MARLLAAVRDTFNGFRSLLATLFGGIWLIFLYGVTVWLVVGSLTAIQIRDEIREAEGEFTFADVGRSYKRYRERESAIYAQWDTSISLFENLTALNGAIEAKFGEIQQAVAPDWTLPLNEFYASDIYERLTVDCIDGETVTTPGCQQLAEYYELSNRYTALEQQIADIDYNALWAEAMRQAGELRGREKLASHFDTYEFFNFTPFYYEEFLKEPPQILVLQLTIVMGMLGSVITMTWSFIKRDGDFTFRRFLILPFVGSMSAFIIFVFIKAGQLTLSAGGAAEQLNPFVLSFVGIISGLLSERAYARMAKVGGNFFQAGDDNPRYGIRLREAMAAGGIGQQELAGYLGLSEEDTAGIVDGKAAAGSLQQQLVAASLRRSIRELFTDLPPDAAQPAPPEPRPPEPAPAQSQPPEAADAGQPS